MLVSDVGKWLIIGGLALALLGAVLVVTSKFFPSLGHLPGDIHVQREGGSFHFPVVTCLVVSAVLTLVINLLLRLFKS